MISEFEFTFEKLEAQYHAAIHAGYEFLTCHQYFLGQKSLPPKTVVNRVDIDTSIRKAERLLKIFDRLHIKASFFVRLHTDDYNPFSFENYRILRAIRDSGHEIGYHSEVVDQSAIWHEDASSCLRRDIDVLSRMLDIPIKGVASHGGMTGLNNLDFWRLEEPTAFGLDYEAYEQSDSFSLFNSSFYISDSEWTQWKCYDKGVLCANDRRTFADHLSSNHSLIYLLVHPDSYYSVHPYE